MLWLDQPSEGRRLHNNYVLLPQVAGALRFDNR